MNNASIQKQTKSQVFSNLRRYHWKGEQMEFAWRKLKGYRTGMWEIPIFKWRENKEVKRELDKRRGITNVSGPAGFRPGQGRLAR